MQLLVTKNQYKRANCVLNISKDLKEVSAYGYNWFKYLHTDEVGNIIISEYSSVSSREHIRDILDTLAIHSIKPVIYLNFCNKYSSTENRPIKSIHDLGHYGQNLKDGVSYGIKHEIALMRQHILYLIAKIKTPRTHKAKNEARKAEIKYCYFKMKDLRNFRDNFLNKKQIKSKVKFTNGYFLGYDNKKELLKTKIFNDIYGRYLKTSDDRQATNYLRSYKLKRANLYQNTSKGISLELGNLCLLFGLNKNYDFTKIIFYSHIQDINASIPSDVDSVEYSEFLKVVKRLKITKESLNTLELDRLHTAIINKAARLERGEVEAKVWTPYEVSEKLLKMEIALNEEKQLLTVIKSQGDLKREGRTMKHCIGQNAMGYHSKILTQNYQAVNYKNYTFFLNPDLTINQTYGKHNSSTPRELRAEFETILKSA